MKRILVTGPVETLAEYAEAARRSGWSVVELPLLVVRQRAVELDPARLARCELALVTSSNALAALERACALVPALRARPLWIVGERSAARAAELGFAPSTIATDAHDLAQRVLALAPRPRSVFWPRGNQSEELARTLRAGGVDVFDPVAYATEPAPPSAPPAADAVFFASPSAVRAWCTLPGAGTHGARSAVAIGATTLEALHAATGHAFRAILSLPEPTSRALELALAHLEPTP